MIPFSIPTLGKAAAAGGGGGFVSDPHRYWRFRNTVAMNGAGLTAISNIVMATLPGGAHALGAVTPTASSTNTGTAANAQDSAISTIWVGNAQPVTLTWDLGATSGNWKDIREVRINVDPAWHPQGPKTFTVDYSDDGSTWTSRITVASETGWDGSALNGWRSRAFLAATVPSVQSGYLFYRWNITVGVDVTQCALGEVEFHLTVGGADILGTSIPFFYTQAAQAWTNVNDNNVGGTGWFGTTGFPYRCGFELPERKVLAEYSMIPYAGFQAYAPKTWTFEGSNDFSTWDVVNTQVNQTGWAANPTARSFAY